MAKIVICGDSFATPDIRCPARHFSEILRDQYHHTVINLARGGISNIGICFQLETAIKIQPDILIVGTTDADRMELVLSPFDITNGAKNIRYTHKISFSDREYVGSASAPIISDTIPTIIGEEDCLKDSYNIDPAIRYATKQYFSYVHNTELKALIDSWALDYWFYKANKVGITILELRKEFPIIYDDKTCRAEWIFHTDFQIQQDAANFLQEKILAIRLTSDINPV